MVLLTFFFFWWEEGEGGGGEHGFSNVGVGAILGNGSEFQRQN